MTRLFSPQRLVLGLVAVLLLGLPVLYFVVNRDHGQGIEPARLLSGAEATGVSEGKLAADFEISTHEGERVRLSDLRGRPVVINFWAQWCGSCLTEMPEIKALQAERGIDAVTVLAINAGETLGQAKAFIDFLDAPFVYGMDVDLTVADAYGVYGLPLSVFIDSEGVIQARYVGHANTEALATLTDAAIEARPAGEIPVALRIVSSIRRERVIQVTAGENSVQFSSRSLRCDPSYCAVAIADGIRALPGVIETNYDAESAALDVVFDPSQTTVTALTDALAGMVEATPDPVYQTEVVVNYR